MKHNPLNEAEQLVAAMQLYALRGQERRAGRLQRRAEELYEEAGLDPAWSDPDSIETERLNPQPKPLLPTFASRDVAELSDDPVDSDEGSGIIVRVDDLVEPEP